jgi:2-C-methyl-D-erythritol 2,4-cyclodiphosphate synthase
MGDEPSAEALRFGLGFDVHPTAGDRPLALGGVRFEGEPGLAGHSDGDVVCHALADALLGAAALGDIGERFPDDDPRWRGIAGTDLLERTMDAVRAVGYAAESCDVTVLADRPAIAPRRDEMREALAAALGLVVARVSVKATRPEGLGLSGDGAACIALAVIRGGR